MDREEGRRAFGADPSGYDRVRPEYPERVYTVLTERCALAPKTSTLEIGPGTGIATRRLLALGADPLVAVESDERLARFLVDSTQAGEVDFEVRATPFEDAELPVAFFGLAVSATAFHWIEPRAGLEKVARLLRPGGWWAMWWTVFGDPQRPDAFHDATARLLEALPTSPSAGISSRAPFALDVAARIADLERAREFHLVGFERHRSTLRLGSQEIRGLYSTFSSFAVLPALRRENLLDELVRVAEDEFGGQVERRLVTAIYTARRRE
jgi:SAM-dependent methyltransferase